MSCDGMFSKDLCSGWKFLKFLMKKDLNTSTNFGVLHAERQIHLRTRVHPSSSLNRVSLPIFSECSFYLRRFFEKYISKDFHIKRLSSSNADSLKIDELSGLVFGSLYEVK